MSQALLSTAFLPPIQYISKIFNSDGIIMESMEHFCKQSYRNRCEIMTANGILPLTIPVEQANSALPIKEMKISYISQWQRSHLRSIKTAYTSSPYFEYFFDDISVIFEKRHKWLWDLNQESLDTILKILKISTPICLSTEYTASPILENGIQDFRNTIHPKVQHQLPDPEFKIKPYRQVFSDKVPFTPNLSIIDLLFCEGYDAKQYL